MSVRVFPSADIVPTPSILVVLSSVFGCSEGFTVGVAVGTSVGSAVGVLVGLSVFFGSDVGCSVESSVDCFPIIGITSIFVSLHTEHV